MSSPRPSPFRRDPTTRPPRSTSPARFFDPNTWAGALLLMVALAAVLWAVQAVNSVHRLTQYGLQPRDAVGLRGVVTEPFLHADWQHLFSNTLPVVFIGWAVLLSGLRLWTIVTAIVVVVGGLLTWLVALSDQLIVGASGVVFGWLGYLLARALFSREVKWIVLAIVVLAFFGTLLFGLLPSVRTGISWQAHACGFVAGVLAAALVHDPAAGRDRSGPSRPAEP